MEAKIKVEDEEMTTTESVSEADSSDSLSSEDEPPPRPSFKPTFKPTFDINTDKVFLTCPKKIKLSEVIPRILKFKFCKDANIVCSKEEYADGSGKHLHVYIETPFKHRWTMPELDYICKTHGHYKRVDRTPRRLISYIVKDDTYDVYPDDFQNEVCRSLLAYSKGENEQLERLAMLDNYNIRGIEPRGNNRQNPDNKLYGPKNK